MQLHIRNSRYDEPAKLKRYFDTVNEKEWSEETILENLNKIFIALNDLIQSDVEYYDARRKTQRRLSTITRGGALVFGTFGMLAPLLQSANQENFKNFAAYGYLFLAIAAVFIAWNKLFGATGGHIRYVTAQLDLGKLITEFRLKWSKWLAENVNHQPKHIKIDEVFILFKSVSDQAYQIVQKETQEWGKATSEALEEYQSSISVKKSPKIISQIKPSAINQKVGITAGGGPDE